MHVHFPLFTPPQAKLRRGQNGGRVIQVPQLFIQTEKELEVHTDAEITPIHLGFNGGYSYKCARPVHSCITKATIN